jgi:hypothetical protein
MDNGVFAHEFYGVERLAGKVKPWTAIYADSREEAERWLQRMLAFGQQAKGKAREVGAPESASTGSLQPQACELWTEEQLKAELKEAFEGCAFRDWQLHSRIEFLRFRFDQELAEWVETHPEVQPLFRVWRHLFFCLFVLQRNQVALRAEAIELARTIQDLTEKHAVGPECFSCDSIEHCERGQAYCMEHPEQMPGAYSQ